MDKLTYVIDIDGTICTQTSGDYGSAKCYADRVKRVNALFDEGHTIIFHTARGMGRSRGSIHGAYQSCFEITKRQLEEWGCKYHKLILGKPAGDVYVDDRAVSDQSFFDE